MLTMKFLLALLLAVAVLAPSLAVAGDCVTRRSGNVTITTFSSDNPKSFNTQCRSYKSGSVTKTFCRN
jgi:hypothetical protein